MGARTSRRGARSVTAQPDLFTGTRPTFKGKTFDAREDQARLETALGRIKTALLSGGKFTLRELAEIGHCSESGASARVRDCRRIHGLQVVSSRVKGGLWRYAIVRP